jgi:hypothetical protein
MQEETRYMTIKEGVKEYFMEYSGDFPEEYDGHFKATYELQEKIFSYMELNEEYLTSKIANSELDFVLRSLSDTVLGQIVTFIPPINFRAFVATLLSIGIYLEKEEQKLNGS